MTPSLHDSVAAENQLLVCCARTEMNSETAARIRHIAAKPLDWDYLLSQAEEHSLVPLLERNLPRAADSAPVEFAAKLKQMGRENAIRCLALSAELIRVMDAIESRGVSALPYKGPITAAQAYRDITARQFEDLDIVLRQCDLEAAHDAVRSLGYAPRFLWIHSAQSARRIVPGEYNYSHSSRRMMVELHTELTLRHFPVRPDLEQFLERAVKVNLGGREVPSFCAEDALLVLCIHGAKDFWQRLLWIADVRELLRAFPALDWDLVLRTAEGLRAQRMLHFGLALAVRLLDAKLPAEISAALGKDGPAANMAADVEKRLLSRDARDRTAAQRFRYRRRMVRGTIPGWLYSIRLTLAPAEEDWEDLHLPRRLTPLYLALRPFRLLRKYGWMNRA